MRTTARTSLISADCHPASLADNTSASDSSGGAHRSDAAVASSSSLPRDSSRLTAFARRRGWAGDAICATMRPVSAESLMPARHGVNVAGASGTRTSVRRTPPVVHVFALDFDPDPLSGLATGRSGEFFKPARPSRTNSQPRRPRLILLSQPGVSGGGSAHGSRTLSWTATSRGARRLSVHPRRLQPAAAARGALVIGSGFLFGLWQGFLLALTGHLLGAAGAFWISRTVGRRLHRTPSRQPPAVARARPRHRARGLENRVPEPAQPAVSDEPVQLLLRPDAPAVLAVHGVDRAWAGRRGCSCTRTSGGWGISAGASGRRAAGRRRAIRAVAGRAGALAGGDVRSWATWPSACCARPAPAPKTRNRRRPTPRQAGALTAGSRVLACA